MDKESKKRKKHNPPNGEGKPKKVRFSLPEDTDKPEKSEPTLRKEAVAAAATASDPASKNDASLSSLRKHIDIWMQKQAEYERANLDELLEESDHEEDHEEEIDIDALETPIRIALRPYTETEKRKSFKFECEWRKCQYMSGTERKYFLHVESHAEHTMDQQSGSYTCEWDLCDFNTDNGDEFVGHVHYHAYHTKLKVHGASIHMLMKLPSCNNDSRMRNTITNRPVTFRCEWKDCDERFNRAMHFFHHVSNHMSDQFEPGKAGSDIPVSCQWSLCKHSFKYRTRALRHLKMHTTQRELACYSCGTVLWARVKYIDHCTRQIEMSQRKYQCPECGRCYATHKLMRAHIEKHDRPHECELCPMKFDCVSAMTKHILYKHLKQRSFMCQQCEYGAFTKKDLTNHMRKHQETKIFRCEEFGCNVAYKTELAIKKHISWHYNLPPQVYECHLCTDKRYTTSFKLSKHFQFVHELQKPPGSGRYRYKADTDGVFRLATYVLEKAQRQPVKGEGKLDVTVVSSDDNSPKDGDGEVAKRKESKGNSRPNKRTKVAENGHDAAAYSPIKGKPNINSILSVGLHEFSIELNIDPERTDAQQSAPETQTAAAAAAAIAAKPKDVKDFTVMKRYLKPSKKLIKTENVH